MSYLHPRRSSETAAAELRAMAWRLIVVLAAAVSVALVSRLALGPALF